MVNYFKHLTLPWLFALVIMLVFTASWYQYEAKLQQHAQIQQFAGALQLSVTPYLLQRDNNVVKAHLNNASAVSDLPIQAIALYSSAGELMASTELPDNIKRFTLDKTLTTFQIEQFENQLIALQPFSASPLFNNSASNSITPVEPGYLLILVNHELSLSVWLLPVLVIGILGLLVLMVIQNTLQSNLQRLQTDISLLTHKLRQLEQGQTNCRIDEDLVSELVPLSQAYNRMAARLIERQLQLKKDVDNQQAALNQANTDLADIRQSFDAMSNIQKKQQKYLLQSVKNFRSFTRQHNVLSADACPLLLDGQVLLFELLKLDSEPLNVTSIMLTEWLASQLQPAYSAMAELKVDLQVIESAENGRYKVQVSEIALNAMFNALLRIHSNIAGVTEITIRLEIKQSLQPATLVISITSDGEGLSARQRQLLEYADLDTLTWKESEFSALVLLTENFGMSRQVQSLDGLGCTISLSLPLKSVQIIDNTVNGSLLIYDELRGRLEERKTAVSNMLSIVDSCAELASLQLKCKQMSFDAVLVFLPAPKDLADWQRTLQQIAKNSRLLCYANIAHAEIWRSALGALLSGGVFSLHELVDLASVKARQCRLLVVDDNQTNLAFLQVLMRDQPVELTVASCGADAILLGQQQSFDVVLLDIQLPDISGTEVARQLRRISTFQHTPILAFTAHALDAEKAEFLAAGMNDVIIKPLQADKLKQILQWCSVLELDNIS